MSQEIISKELLSEVLGYSVLTEGYIKENENNNLYWGMMGCRAPDDCEGYEEHINIHELVYKCKEWAWNEGFIMATYKSQSSGWLTDLFYMDKEGITDHEYGDDGFIQTFTQWVKGENSDIKSCQWILENKTNS